MFFYTQNEEKIGFFVKITFSKRVWKVYNVKEPFVNCYGGSSKIRLECDFV